MMGDRVKSFYEQSTWGKGLALCLLGFCCVVVAAVSGGFPPWAWRFLIQVLMTLPQLWAVQGGAIFRPLLGLLLLSLALLIIWASIVMLVFKVVTRIWRDRSAERSFQADLEAAELISNQQMAKVDRMKEHVTRPDIRGERQSRPSKAAARPLSRPVSNVHLDEDVPTMPRFQMRYATAPIEDEQMHLAASVPSTRPLYSSASSTIPRRQSRDLRVKAPEPPAPPKRLRIVPNGELNEILAENVDDVEAIEELDRAFEKFLEREQQRDHLAQEATHPDTSWDEDEYAEDDGYATRDLVDEDEHEEFNALDEDDSKEVDLFRDDNEEAGNLESDPIGVRLQPMRPSVQRLRFADVHEEDKPHLSNTATIQPMLAALSRPAYKAASRLTPQTDSLRRSKPEYEAVPRLGIGIGLDPGLVRKEAPNEDSVFAIEGMRVTDGCSLPAGLFIVADGMGGHLNGREASRTTVHTMSDIIVPALLRDVNGRNMKEEETLFQDLLKDGVHRANLALYRRNRDLPSMMGTTVTAALVANATAYIANVGDSRTYLYRPSEGLMQITKDHSVVARMAENNQITYEEIYTHPKRNQIYRCLGERASVEMDCFVMPLQVEDLLILCSDGLWEMVRDAEIVQIVANATRPTQISAQLVQAALNNGGADNISVIVAGLMSSDE